MPICMIGWKQRDNDSVETGTSWILWPHGTTTPRTQAEPIMWGTARSLTASLDDSHSHWDTHEQKSQSLPGPDQLRSQVTRKSRFIHPATEPNGLGPTMPEVPVTPLMPPMERSVLPHRTPPVHAVTPRTTSPQPWWSIQPPQRLIEEIPQPGRFISELWGLYILYGLCALTKAIVY